MDYIRLSSSCSNWTSFAFCEKTQRNLHVCKSTKPAGASIDRRGPTHPIKNMNLLRSACCDPLSVTADSVSRKCVFHRYFRCYSQLRVATLMAVQGKKSTTLWSDREIRSLRHEIKSEIDLAISRGGNEGGLNWIFNQLSALSSLESDESVIRSYILIMSALLHHVKYGSLTSSKVNQLYEEASQLLRSYRISPSHRRLGVLYSDLQAAMSQINLNSGSIWASAWHQQIAAKLTRGHPDRDQAYTALGLGIRALRLGLGGIAERELALAESSHKVVKERCKARLYRIMRARIANDWELFDALTTDFGTWNELSNEMATDLKWEMIAARAARVNAVDEMMPLIQRRGSHYQSAYVVEGRLRILCEMSPSKYNRLTKINTIKSDRSLAVHKEGEAYKALVALDEGYDDLTHSQVKMDQIGKTLSRLHFLRSVEQEMLVLVAATRWLSRNGHTSLAELCLAEYSAKCLKFSVGKTQDSLNCASDLLDRTWFLRVS